MSPLTRQERGVMSSPRPDQTIAEDTETGMPDREIVHTIAYDKGAGVSDNDEGDVDTTASVGTRSIVASGTAGMDQGRGKRTSSILAGLVRGVATAIRIRKGPIELRRKLFSQKGVGSTTAGEHRSPETSAKSHRLLHGTTESARTSERRVAPLVNFFAGVSHRVLRNVVWKRDNPSTTVVERSLHPLRSRETASGTGQAKIAEAPTERFPQEDVQYKADRESLNQKDAVNNGPLLPPDERSNGTTIDRLFKKTSHVDQASADRSAVYTVSNPIRSTETESDAVQGEIIHASIKPTQLGDLRITADQESFNEKSAVDSSAPLLVKPVSMASKVGQTFKNAFRRLVPSSSVDYESVAKNSKPDRGLIAEGTPPEPTELRERAMPERHGGDTNASGENNTQPLLQIPSKKKTVARNSVRSRSISSQHKTRVLADGGLHTRREATTHASFQDNVSAASIANSVKEVVKVREEVAEVVDRGSGDPGLHSLSLTVAGKTQQGIRERAGAEQRVLVRSGSSRTKTGVVPRTHTKAPVIKSNRREPVSRTINVTIGRIDVQAAPESKRTPQPAHTSPQRKSNGFPLLSLEDYLKDYSRGNA